MDIKPKGGIMDSLLRQIYQAKADFKKVEGRNPKNIEMSGSTYYDLCDEMSDWHKTTVAGISITIRKD